MKKAIPPLRMAIGFTNVLHPHFVCEMTTTTRIMTLCMIAGIFIVKILMEANVGINLKRQN